MFLLRVPPCSPHDELVAKGEELGRVGRAVAARRGELGMTQQELADRAGVDLKTVYNLESGTRWPIAKTRAAVSAALQWEGDALTAIADEGPELLPEPAAESAEDEAYAVVTALRARRGEPGVWADLRDYLARAGLFDDDDSTELEAWPPGAIPAELTPRAKDALDAAARAGVLFRDAVGDSAARLPYDWHLRVRMITQLRETARNPTRARRAG